jgi:uncharacterized protein (TIGR02453 family)
MGYFAPELFSFLRQLNRNNNREWFAKNKQRYLEEVQEPVLDFVEAVAPGLRKISANFVADPRPVGGSMFRIYRDTRFAADKSPYKTHVGIRFPHRAGRDVHAPGFYLHLEPGEIFVGAGIWHPDSKTATTIREAIVERPAAWKKAVHSAPFSKAFRLSGDSLTRAPRGFDANHALVDDLRRKDFIGVKVMDEKTATGDRFLATFLAACGDGAPLVRFLCSATGVAY